ncbi:MAG: UvrD-helicase domain-containing protein [Proteobacteria bacterium]|nr:UvrD-helicase domain-containing protein [Pseudomonadota bacterium]
MSDSPAAPDAAEGPPTAPPPGRAPAAYLAALNPAQREAVEATEGPVLVLAGAGTGKTRVLTTRFAHLLMTGRAAPNQVLAVTFTNKAAREMKERIARLIGRPVEGLWLGTFHALSARLLRRHAALAGLAPNFTILDTDDQLRLVKQVAEAANLDTRRWTPQGLLAVIETWKNRGLGPDEVGAADATDFAAGRALALYRDYQARLRALNAADFGDLLLHALAIFRTNAEVLGLYQRAFRYILVDEYQDTNVAQYLWLRLLAQRHRNICCVGDDDQSIYSWRGAEVGNILRFEHDFPGARVIRLECNYRSTPHILAAASGLIAHNQGRLGKTLWTEDGEGEKVRLRGLWDGEEEARFVCDEVEALQGRGERLGAMAVLVRAGFQMRAFEERLLTLGIPYRVLGGPRFYERQEVRDAIAYLRVVANPSHDLSFERIVNVPKRGIGEATVKSLHELARARGVPVFEAARDLVATDELRAKARVALKALIDDFDRWRSLAGGLAHPELARTVLEESGYTAMWQADRSPDAPGRLENLKELVAAMEEFENLEGFLEHVSLVMENDQAEDGERLNLMTLHAAKGLEFDTVFLPGWEEGLFPHQRALDEGGLKSLEEERRLAHVGITRARRRVVVSFAANRRVYSTWQSNLPSRFVDELPAEHVERESEPGLYGAGSAATDLEEGAARLRAPRFGGQARLIEAEAWTVETHARPAGTFAVGGRVFHQKFGYGRVVSTDGAALEIEFEKAGRKKVIDRFVEPA